MRTQTNYIDIVELIDAKENIAPVVPIEILTSPFYRFDLSRHNPDIAHVDMGRPETLRKYIVDTLTERRCGWGFGGWGEDRALYKTHPFFKDKAGDHSIHLGMDIWLPAETPVFVPFTGTVHGFKDNSTDHNYGPSIITEHRIGDASFTYSSVTSAYMRSITSRKGRRCVLGTKSRRLHAKKKVLNCRRMCTCS